MKFHPLFPVILLGLATTACQRDAGEKDVLRCAATLSAIDTLRADYPFPTYFQNQEAVKQGNEFDPMLYFTVLDHLSMETGYVLDFVYTNDGLGGYPTLLARPSNELPYRSWDDVPSEQDSYLTHILTDGTEEGFFQLALLSLLGEQFYLFWHANYNDWRVVCRQEDITAIVKEINESNFGKPFSTSERRLARQISDIAPQVRLDEETVEVQLVAFTRWGGFYRWTWVISRQFPHTFLSTQREQLVPYHCGIIF